MDAQSIPLKTTGIRFVRAVRTFARSEVGWKAKLIFAALILLLCASNALNVINSYVGRNFMTAIADRDMPGFVRQAFFYIAVFAALTLVAVIARFGEERLGLLWRDTMTRGILRRYLADGTYQQLNASEAIANPDQRISEDVRAFTVTTLSFALMALNSAFTIVAFSGVLWTISPLLFGVAVLYAAGGSLFTFLFGRPLIRLNYDQLDKEASFRSGLIDVRNNAEAIMTAREEHLHMDQLLGRLDDLVTNFRKITSINRNVGFFTTGYNWMIQIIPALIIAPAFIERKIEFGVITQSAVAFSNSCCRVLPHRDSIPVAVELRRGRVAAERPRRGRRTVGRPSMRAGAATDAWEQVIGVVARAMLPEISPGSYFAPQVRYGIDFEGNDDGRLLRQLRIAPTLNINLPHNLFFTLFPSPDIRLNYGTAVWNQTGRLFLPLNFMVGWKPTEHTMISAEFGIPIIKDFPVYTFKTQLRVGYLF